MKVLYPTDWHRHPSKNGQTRQVVYFRDEVIVQQATIPREDFDNLSPPEVDRATAKVNAILAKGPSAPGTYDVGGLRVEITNCAEIG